MTADRKQFFERSSGFILATAAFFMPLLPAVSKISTGVVLLLWLVRGNPLTTLTGITANRPALALILLFLVYFGGVAISSDMNYAWKDVLSKVPFLLVPLLFSGLAPLRNRSTITLAFAAGTGLLCVILLIRAFVNYQSVGENYVFFYEAFSWKLHPTYLAMYVSFALLVLLHHEQELLAKKTVPAWALAFLYFLGTAVLILSSSRMGIIASLAATYFYLVQQVRNKSMGAMRWIYYGLAPVLLFLVLNYGLNTASRFSEVKKVVNTGIQTDHGSIAARVKIWEASVELIRENFWTGTGTGDVQEELKKLYVRNDLHYALGKNLNAHNQFLQTLLATGIFGLVILLAVFVLAGIKGWREQKYLWLSFLLIVVLNSLTEAVLEREAGVLWFSFFYGLFFCLPPAQKAPSRAL